MTTGGSEFLRQQRLLFEAHFSVMTSTEKVGPIFVCVSNGVFLQTNHVRRACDVPRVEFFQSVDIDVRQNDVDVMELIGQIIGVIQLRLDWTGT